MSFIVHISGLPKSDFRCLTSYELCMSVNLDKSPPWTRPCTHFVGVDLVDLGSTSNLSTLFANSTPKLFSSVKTNLDPRCFHLTAEQTRCCSCLVLDLFLSWSPFWFLVLSNHLALKWTLAVGSLTFVIKNPMLTHTKGWNWPKFLNYITPVLHNFKLSCWILRVGAAVL